jgi:LuxR family maltose regulon positive regulatory protein
MLELEQIVVATKLTPPVSRRRRLIGRKRLSSFFSATDKPKLSLVTAPAGYGKTSLLYQWYEAIQIQGHLACWVSLDALDVSPARFLRHIIAAIDGQHPGFGRAAMRYLDNVRSPDIRVPLGGLVNDIIAINRSLVLFLDDYHLIDSSGVDRFIDDLLNLMPTNFHLVISSRVVPDLDLPRLRLRDELLELDTRSLQFDKAETFSFLALQSAAALSPAQIELFHERSEGWVAGLQLAVEALRSQAGNPDPSDTNNPSDTPKLRSFVSGNFRDIADYLAKAVLASQPVDIRAFLTQVSILERFNADICEAITGNPQSQEIIESLERANLFVVPLDNERRWYRYHHLFQEFLQGALRRNDPSSIVHLYRKASEWFYGNGFGTEAVKYALLSGDENRAAEMVETHALNRVMAGYIAEAMRWLGSLPRVLRQGNPSLISLECLCIWHMYKQEEATQFLGQLERALKRWAPGADPDRKSILQNDMRLHRAGINVCGGKNPLQTLRYLDEIELELLSDFYRGIYHNLRGLALCEMNKFDDAVMNYRSAAQIYRQIPSSFSVAICYYLEAMVEFERANLQAIELILANAAQEPMLHLSSSCYLYSPLHDCIEAVLNYERGNYEEALRLLDDNRVLAVEVGHIKMVCLVQITYAGLLLEKGLLADAEMQLDELAAHLQRNEPSNARALILADYERMRLALRNGNLMGAHRLGETYDINFKGAPPPLPAQWDRLPCLAALAWCRAQLAMGEPRKAVEVLRRIAVMAMQAGRKRRYLECKILEAIAMDVLGENYEAGTIFSGVLAKAAEEGLVRLIADEGERSLLLVQRLKADGACVGIDAGFIKKLFKNLPKIESVFEFDLASPAHERGVTFSQNGFSDKEKSLLRLLEIGKSNKEISRRLDITHHTVKWYLRNIFAKLQVRNRTAAVVAAKANRLI